MQVLEREDVVLAGVGICLDADELHYDAAEVADCACLHEASELVFGVADGVGADDKGA